MELTALVEGLRLAEDHHLLTFEINIDSKKVISMLKVGNLLDECRSRTRRLGRIQVTHCFREENGVVDAMTKLGAITTGLKETFIFLVPLMYAWKAIWTDITGTYFERLFNIFVISIVTNDSSYFVLQTD